MRRATWKTWVPIALLLLLPLITGCDGSPTLHGVKVTVGCNTDDAGKIHYTWHGVVESISDHYDNPDTGYSDTDSSTSRYVRETWKPSKDGEIQNGYQQVTLTADMPNDWGNDWSMTKHFAVSAKCNATFT